LKSATTASQSAITLRVPRVKPRLTVILNALPEQARYTSAKNAERLVRHGLAIATRAGIVLLPVEQIRRLEALAALTQADDRMIEERGGVLWWNGCDHRPSAAHRPGENVLLPRTDRAKAYFACLEER
jgi:hypothetical protein